MTTEVLRRAMIRVKATGSCCGIYGVKKYTHKEGSKRMQREEIDPKEEEIEERRDGREREEKKAKDKGSPLYLSTYCSHVAHFPSIT